MGPSGRGSRLTSAFQSRSITPSSLKTDGDLEKNDVQVEEKEVDDFEDPEAANQGHAKRPMILTHSVMVGLTLILLLAVESIVISKVVSLDFLTYDTSNWLGQVLLEVKYDSSYTRLAYLAVTPIFAGFAFGSALLIVFSAFQIFAPINDNRGNSRYYSATPPNPARFRDDELPHITIQIPVFMEGLTRWVFS
jgi:hypothetical protein